MGAGVNHYCTLFDSAYLSKGLALYYSLARHSSAFFKLYILPMDQATNEILEALDLPMVELIDLDDFETSMGMAEAKSNRSAVEYFWTCASNLTEYCLRFDINECNYVDADVYFFADPAPVFTEIGQRAIAITPHQFPESPEKARLEKSGIYNVGFIHFKKTEAGMSCLAQWAADVRNRCSADVGCGDQGYLDFFERDFGKEVCVLGHGVNTGPWNLMGYDVTQRDGYIYLGADRLVCYHAHEFRENEDGTFRLTNYPLRQSDIDQIYTPYIEAIRAAHVRIESVRQPA